MTDAPLILSKSSVETYLSCGYKYLLGSVWRLPGEPNMAASIGSAVHAGIEALHKERLWREQEQVIGDDHREPVLSMPAPNWNIEAQLQDSVQVDALSTLPNIRGGRQLTSEKLMPSSTETVIQSSEIQMVTSKPNTGSSWSKFSIDHSGVESPSITKTALEQTTDRKISNSGLGPFGTANEPPISFAPIAGDPTFSTAQEALRASFVDDVAQMSLPHSEPPTVALRDALTMLAVYREKVTPTFKPTLVEAPFIISIDGILFSGQIDAADEDVRDVKTTAGMTINGKRPSQFKPDRHRFQLTGYGLGYKWLTGRSPRRYLIDLLTRRGAYRQYVVEPDVGEFMEVLGVASDGILSQTFEPTGVSNGECRYCPFLDHGCKYGVID